MATIEPKHLRESARLCTDTLRPYVDRDWTTKAGCLEWSVDETVIHMLSAMSKYILCMAADNSVFIATRVRRFDGASNAEVVASLEPVASALANVCTWVDPCKTGFHATGPKTATDFLSIACTELLVHTWDVLQGFGVTFEPPLTLAEVVLQNEYPGTAPDRDPWRTLILATGREFTS